MTPQSPSVHRNLRLLSPENKRRKQANPKADPNQEVYHFIGCVPFRAEAWEPGGLESKPVEVGELFTTPSPSGPEMAVNRSWLGIVHPVLGMTWRG